MINKFYEKLKQFIKKNYLYLSLYAVLIATLLFPLPYYIYNGGGIINIDEKINIENSNTNKGTFNMCYVSEIKATIPSYFLAKIFSDWDISPKEDVALSNKETDTDVYNRDRIMLNDANVNAIHNAYLKANKTFKITDTYNYVIYISDAAKTTLKIGDIIEKVDNEKINSLDDLKDIVSKKQVGDIINFQVKRNNKIKNCTSEVVESNKIKQIGISVQTAYNYETSPKIELNFSKNESGPSGGLMLTLSIYNHLIDKDLTNGMKIAGTGTIDWDGNVGSIGGVKYKLAGAVKSKADIFLVPNGENYKEAIRLKEKKKYNIKIIGISTFNEALEKLEEMVK